MGTAGVEYRTSESVWPLPSPAFWNLTISNVSWLFLRSYAATGLWGPLDGPWLTMQRLSCIVVSPGESLISETNWEKGDDPSRSSNLERIMGIGTALRWKWNFFLAADNHFFPWRLFLGLEILFWDILIYFCHLLRCISISSPQNTLAVVHGRMQRAEKCEPPQTHSWLRWNQAILRLPCSALMP